MIHYYPHREYSFMFQAGHLEKIQHKMAARTVEIDAGLTKNQTLSLYGVLSTHNFSGPEPDGEGYVLHGKDSCSLRVRLWAQADHDYQNVSSIPVEFITKTIDDDTLQIILDIAVATNMILIDSVGKNVRYVGREPNTLELEKWEDAARIDTIDELRVWMSEEIGGREIDVNP